MPNGNVNANTGEQERGQRVPLATGRSALVYPRPTGSTATEPTVGTIIDRDFQLIETMRCDPGSGVALIDLHLQRLGRSARALHFSFDPSLARARVVASTPAAGGTPLRLRLLLFADGRIETTAIALPHQAFDLPPVLRSAQPIDSREPLQQHKTTRRERYDADHARATQRGSYEVIYLNERDELAEASRHNLVLQLGGRLLTPPLSSGALPGVFRASLLARQPATVEERILRMDDLRHAERVFLCNAVRGMVEVRCNPDDAPL